MRQAVGQNLLQQRLSMGFCQRAIADQLGVSAATLSLWERGLSPISLDHLCRLAATYHASMADLLDGVDPVQDAPAVNLDLDLAR